MDVIQQNTPVPEASAPENGASIWSIIGGVFGSPTKAFADYAKRPMILWPLIITIVLACLAAGLSAPFSGQVQMDMLSQSTVIPPSQLEQMREEAENPVLWKSYGFGWVPILIIGLLAALIALFMGRFVFGGEGAFKATWGVELLSGLIPLVGGLLKLPLVFAKESVMVSLGPAALMAGKDFTSIVYSFLFYTDFFAIWGIIVAGFGYAAVFGLSKGKGMTIAIAAYVIVISMMIGLTVVGLSFAGVDVSFF